MNDTVNSINVTPTENYLRELVFMLSVRKVLIFFVAAIIFGLVVMVALFWPAKYTASAKVIISRNVVEPSLGTLEKVDYRVERVSKEDLNSEAQLLLSGDLIKQVILLLQKEGKVFPESENNEEWFAKQILRVQSAIVVDAIPYSKVIDISLIWGNAQEAKLLLETLLTHYLTYRIELEGYSGKNEFFVELSKDYLNRIDTANKKIAEVMLLKNVISPEAEIKNNLEVKFSLEKSLSKGELKQVSLNKSIELLEKKIQEKDVQFFSFLENEAVTQFSKQIQELFIQKAKTEGVFVPESKAVRGMEMQLKAAYHNLITEVETLKEELESQVEVLDIQNKMIANKIQEMNQRNADLKRAQFSIESLENENNVLQMSFEIFFKRKEEAALASNSVINESDVSILSHATLPLTATFPNKKVLIPFGFIVACLGGLIVGFLTEFLDHTFKRPEDISQILAMKLLISISDN